MVALNIWLVRGVKITLKKSCDSELFESYMMSRKKFKKHVEIFFMGFECHYDLEKWPQSQGLKCHDSIK